ncbi:MAG TPA: uracil-DNA glycosylase [Chitinophagaceae bacterium]|nr:uracil-DNA glycosylase [Chitinophagaceae bacterium]
MNVQLEESWKQVLHDEFEQPYFHSLVQFLKKEKQSGKRMYPEGKNIFRAFSCTPFPSMKVLILGQDPYHGEGQAHGLSFSVPDGVRIPPSLQNIFKEVAEDTGHTIPESGNLTRWAEQGVLLLNASLTVEANTPMSHSRIGWELFTNQVIARASELKEKMVFLLWGRFAGEKEKLIDTNKHLILKAPHPSPFSAHTGFLGCRHFSQTNAWLKANGLNEIEW